MNQFQKSLRNNILMKFTIRRWWICLYGNCGRVMLITAKESCFNVI